MPPGVPKFNKIRTHPDVGEIDKRLQSGEAISPICGDIMERYPGDFMKHLNASELSKYRRWKFPEVADKVGRKRNISSFPEYNEVEDEVEEDGEDDSEEPPYEDVPDTDIQTRRKRSKRRPEGIDIGKRLMVLTGRTPPPPEPRRFISDERIMSWVNGIEGFSSFVEDMIMERGRHIELQDYQREIAKAFLEYPRVVVCTGGQVGKDLMILSYSMWLALINPGSTQLVLCSTQTQSTGLFDRTIENINMDSELAASISNAAKKPEYVIFFKNGSKIYYLTAKSRIAGKTNILCAWINEARDIREEEVTRVTPLLGIAGGKLFVLSRPRFRRGYFWDMYDKCLKNPAFKTFQIPTFQNKYFDKSVYDTELTTLSPDLFKVEYLGQFADAGSSYFSETAIDKCSRAEYDYKGMNPEPEYDYSLGVDWARLRDTCVLTVIGKRRKHLKNEFNYKVFHLFAFSPEGGEPSTFDHHFAYIQMLDNRFSFHYIIPESSGMGIPLSDRLEALWRQERRAGVVRPYENRSLQAKIGMYENAKHIIESEDVELPRNADRLINELKMTQFGTTLHGTLRIETTITDDYADCLCLALIAWKQPFEIGIATVKLPSAQPDMYVRS